MERKTHSLQYYKKIDDFEDLFKGDSINYIEILDLERTTNIDYPRLFHLLSTVDKKISITDNAIDYVFI